MIKTCRYVSILVALFTVSCQSASPRYFQRPQLLATPGPYLHESSGMTFPLRVGEFQRVSLYQYDAEGHQVSAGYNLHLQPNPIIATVYISPAPRIISIGSPEEVIASARSHAMADVFEATKQEITQAHEGAVFIEEKEITVSKANQRFPGRLLTFEYNQVIGPRVHAVRSHLLLFGYIGGKWIIKYRFTHPKSFDASSRIDQFLRELRWTLIDS